jgi:hypothetical protein
MIKYIIYNYISIYQQIVGLIDLLFSQLVGYPRIG